VNAAPPTYDGVLAAAERFASWLSHAGLGRSDAPRSYRRDSLAARARAFESAFDAVAEWLPVDAKELARWILKTINTSLRDGIADRRIELGTDVAAACRRAVELLQFCEEEHCRAATDDDAAGHEPAHAEVARLDSMLADQRARLARVRKVYRAAAEDALAAHSQRAQARADDCHEHFRVENRKMAREGREWEVLVNHLPQTFAIDRDSVTQLNTRMTQEVSILADARAVLDDFRVLPLLVEQECIIAELVEPMLDERFGQAHKKRVTAIAKIAADRDLSEEGELRAEHDAELAAAEATIKEIQERRLGLLAELRRVQSDIKRIMESKPAAPPAPRFSATAPLTNLG
jgi:hypothetical protein